MFLWRSRSATHSVSTSVSTSVAPSTTASNTFLSEKYPQPLAPAALTEAVAAAAAEQTKEKVEEEKKKSKPWKILGWSWTSSKQDNTDIEKGPAGPSPRPIRLFAPVYGGLGAALSICTFSVCFV